MKGAPQGRGSRKRGIREEPNKESLVRLLFPYKKSVDGGCQTAFFVITCCRAVGGTFYCPLRARRFSTNYRFCDEQPLSRLLFVRGCPGSPFPGHPPIVSGDQPQPLQLPGVLRPGGDQVDPGGLDAGMAQHVRQLRHILMHPVEGPGEQVAQVVGEDFRRRDACLSAQALHLRPDLAAGHPLPGPGAEELPRKDPLLLRVPLQLPAQPAGDQDRPDLTLHVDIRPPLPHGLSGDVLHLADPDPGGADGLHQQGKPFFPLLAGGLNQAEVLFF